MQHVIAVLILVAMLALILFTQQNYMGDIEKAEQVLIGFWQARVDKNAFGDDVEYGWAMERLASGKLIQHYVLIDHKNKTYLSKKTSGQWQLQDKYYIETLEEEEKKYEIKRINENIFIYHLDQDEIIEYKRSSIILPTPPRKYRKIFF